MISVVATQICFGNFHPEPWGRFPFWLIIFRWVETTNQWFLERQFSDDVFYCGCLGRVHDRHFWRFMIFPAGMLKWRAGSLQLWCVWMVVTVFWFSPICGGQSFWTICRHLLNIHVSCTIPKTNADPFLMEGLEEECSNEMWAMKRNRVYRGLYYPVR